MNKRGFEINMIEVEILLDGQADFRTERLRVTRIDDIAPQDRAALERELAPILTSSVLAHLPPSMQLNDGPGAVGKWLDDLRSQAQVYSIRQSDRLIGILILATEQNARGVDVHLGYLLGEFAWGVGYTSELVAGLVSAVQPGVRLIGGVGLDNPASARVLTKSGFVRHAEMSDPQTDVFVYSASPAT